MMRPFSKITLVCVAVFLVGGGQALAAGANAGFTRGNALYASGDFAGAAAAYEGQVHRGEFTANLFYNLADAYYRQGNRGQAILNYQRALLLDPSHAEAAANLAFVRGQKPPAASARPGWMVADGLPWVTATAGWLAVAGLVVAISGRRWRVAGWALAAAGLAACVGGVAAIGALDDGAAETTRAVVVTDSAPFLYAPADNSKVITTMTAGGEVRVLSDQGAWIYVLLGDGTRAWVSTDRIERIIPK